MSKFQVDLSVGNDNGNSEHDIIINGDIIRQPNVFSIIRKLPNLEELNEEWFISNIEDNLITSISTPILNNGTPSTYYIGNYAVKSGSLLRNIEVGAFNSKLDSDIPIVNTLSQLAGYAVKKVYLEDLEGKETNKVIEKINVNADMTTALPVTQYNHKTGKIFAAKFLDYTHKVTVHLPTKSIEVIISFNYVKVLPESIPVIFYLQGIQEGDPIIHNFNEQYNLNVNGEYFKGKRILHVAIGEGTTEYPLTEDIRFNPNFIEGSNNGIGHAIESILSDFIKTKHLVKFSRQDYSIAIKDSTNRNHEDAVTMLEIPLEEQAETILRYMKKEVAKANNDVDIICVHGGGSIPMRDFIYKDLIAFCNAIGTKALYIPSEKAVTLEALGMYEFTIGPIFQALKEKYMNQKE